MIEWTAEHRAVQDAYLRIRWPAGRTGEEMEAAELSGRQGKPNGQGRLAGKVPELAPDQAALASLLAEVAILMRLLDFASPTILRNAQTLHDLVSGSPMHSALEQALRPYVARGASKRHDRRDDAIRFAVHAALEADIPATARGNTPSACRIVSESLCRSDLGEITPGSVAAIWRGRTHKLTRHR